MPIIEPAPWRHQYFENVACPDDVFIPTDDPEAWAWNPEHRWVFDKLQVALSQGLPAAPHGVDPPFYPVFSKPITNLRGMGAGSRIITGAADYARQHTPGHMWMPLLEGAHVSTDLAVVAGEVRWTRHATGRPTHGGMFDYWTVHARPIPELAEPIRRWIAIHLAGYTGMVNVETIGGTVIDVHLRFSDQWPDLYGPGWGEALVGLYRDKTWRFADMRRRDGFSLALFVAHGSHYRHPPAAVLGAVRSLPEVSSIQITFHEDRNPALHAMPPGGFRLALVNCWDLRRGRAAREALAKWFSGPGLVEPGRPDGSLRPRSAGRALREARRSAPGD
jgi:hypothetical protein